MIKCVLLAGGWLGEMCKFDLDYVSEVMEKASCGLITGRCLGHL